MKRIYRRKFNWDRYKTAKDIVALSRYHVATILFLSNPGSLLRIFSGNDTAHKYHKLVHPKCINSNHSHIGTEENGQWGFIDCCIDNGLIWNAVAFDDLFNDGIIQRTFDGEDICIELNARLPQHFKDIWKEAKVFLTLEQD